MERKRASVWSLFKVTESGHECNLCKKVLSKCGNTSNLWQHLRYNHAARSEVKELLTPKAPPVKRHASEDMTKYMTGVSDTDFLYFITKDTRPLSVVEGEGFRRLLEKLKPNVHIPPRQGLSRLLDTVYETEKEKILQELVSIGTVAVTTDSWSSRATQNYMSLTVHYIDENFDLKEKILCVQLFDDSHTSDNLADWIRESLQSWRISDKTIAIVTDNAPNIRKAAKAVTQHVQCTAHVLNLVVQDALKRLNSDVVVKVRKTATFFHKSVKAARQLNDLQPEHGEKGRLVQDVVTRWNSTHDMIVSYLETKASVQRVVVNNNRSDLLLSADDITHLEGVVKVLRPFKLMTAEMSSSSVTLSKVIPMVQILQTEMEAAHQIHNTTFTEALVKGLKDRFTDVEENDLKAKASVLDTRFGRYAFSENDSYHRAVDMVRNELMALHDDETDVSDIQDAPAPPSESDKESVWALIDERVKQEQTVATDSRLAVVTREMEAFTKEVVLNRDSDILKYYQANVVKYPLLSQLAKKYLCIPGTSVPSERLFSLAGNVISEKRARLSPENASRIIFLNKNWRL